ncbi:MAG: FAD-dependent oxidoreductase [Alphaproteobacteria bacterium]|nr:FAD-dependent oxidoreductase [Alphaproteobacteria bacterium]
MTAPNHAPLFRPIRLGKVEVRNRFVITAHAAHFGEAGLPSERHVRYHQERARGGVGMIVFEAIRVHPTSLPSWDAMAGWKPDIVPALKRVVDAVRGEGASIMGQIVHQGSQVGSQAMRPVMPLWAPSPIACARYSEVPHEMTGAEIEETIAAHAVSARHVRMAGFDGVEIHAAHGYLPQQFLSPVTNHRKDEWGGSLENRMRYLHRVIETVRAEVGSDYTVGLRISGDELYEGGLGLEAMQEVAAIIAREGRIDYLSVTHCNYQSNASYASMIPDMHYKPAPYTYIAGGIKKVAGDLPVIAVGRIYTPDLAAEVLAKGEADMVATTRAHVADPEFVRKTREGRAGDIRLCIGCNQGCVGMAHAGKPMSCVVNPAVGMEAEWGVSQLRPTAKARRVAVVGGGPAGMEAARVAAERGHQVTLFEQGSELGGQVRLIVRQTGRDMFGALPEYQRRELARLKVDIRLGARAEADAVLALKPDAVVVATGAVPALPDIPAEAGAPPVMSEADALSGKAPASGRVVLLDLDAHYKAAATSEWLAERGCTVFHVTPRGALGAEIPAISVVGVNQRLRERKVKVMVASRIGRLVAGGAVVQDAFSGEAETLADIAAVIVAAPYRADNALAAALRARAGASGPEIIVIGDAAAPRRAFEAMNEGHRAGWAL